MGMVESTALVMREEQAPCQRMIISLNGLLPDVYGFLQRAEMCG